MQTVPVSSITHRTSNARTILSKEGYVQLRESIRAKGILEPLLVRLLEDNSYELLAGNNRLEAALELKGKFPRGPEVPIAVTNAPTLEDAEEINLIENMIRTDIHPADVAARVKVLCDRGKSRKDLSASLGISVQLIGHYTRLAGQEDLFAAWHKDAKKGSWTPALRDMITIAAKEKPLEVYEALCEARRAALSGVVEEGPDGKGEKTKSKLKRQSAAALNDTYKFLTKLEKSWERGGENPATGRAPTPAERAKVDTLCEVMAWVVKAKKDLADPVLEFMAEEVVEEEEGDEE